MAYTFDRDTSQYLSADLSSPISQPIVLFAKTRSSYTATSQGVVFYGDKDHASNRYLLQLQAAANTPVRYILQNLAGTTTALTFTPGFTINTWTKLLGRSLSATDHKFWQDSKTAQTSSQSNTPSNTDRIEFGRHGGSGAGSYLEGDIAFAFVADALTDTQAAQLLAGRHPRNVFGPGELVHLWTLQSDGDLTDEISSLVLTANNGPTYSASPVDIWTGSTASFSAGASVTIEGTGLYDVQGTGKLELADSATYASANKVEQTVTEWADDHIDFTASLGALSAGTLYVFITNSEGERSAAFEVTVSEGGGGPTPVITSTPTSVKAKTVQIITGTDFGTTQGNGKVELSDNATYGAGTLIEQSIVEKQHQTRVAAAEFYWSDTEIRFRYTLGSLSAGTLYLFVTNDDGNTSDAEEINVSVWSFASSPTTQQTTTGASQVVEELDIDVNDADGIVVAHDNVTIKNCRIKYTQHVEGAGDAAYAIEATNRSNLHIEDVEIFLTDFTPGQNPLSVTSSAMRFYNCNNVTWERVRVFDAASGFYAELSTDIHGRYFECHRMRGPMPRGQAGQFNNCDGDLIVEDFYVLNPANNSWPEDGFNNYSTNGAIYRRGVMDGCNAPTGTAIMFEEDSAEGLVEDVQIYRHSNGGPAAYIGHNITFRRVDIKHHIGDVDQGRGAPSSNGLCYTAHPDSTGLIAEDCLYFDLGGALLVWDATSFSSREMTQEDFEEVEPISLEFPWDIADPNIAVVPLPITMTLSTFAPDVIVSNKIEVVVNHFLIFTATFPPTVLITDLIEVVPGTASLTTTTFAPTVTVEEDEPEEPPELSDVQTILRQNYSIDQKIKLIQKLQPDWVRPKLGHVGIVGIYISLYEYLSSNEWRKQIGYTREEEIIAAIRQLQ